MNNSKEKLDWAVSKNYNQKTEGSDNMSTKLIDLCEGLQLKEGEDGYRLSFQGSNKRYCTLNLQNMQLPIIGKSAILQWAKDRIQEKKLWWDCKHCGENESPGCHKCVRSDGKNVSDELDNK